MIYGIILLAISSALYTGTVQAQDNSSPTDQDSSNEQTEAREDAYRKQMELEGSRDQDTFSNTTYTSQAKQEKIDKLPKESRDNIRHQLTDLIIENGQWEPFDALREYPYEPSEAAQEDPGLRKREKEAWAEQMEKYHKREARAFEASRPAMPGGDSQQAAIRPGPGNQQVHGQSEQGQSQNGATGKGEQQGESKAGESTSEDERGQQGSQGSSASSASSYHPYQSQQNDDTDEISTAGVSESALDFLKARQQLNSSSAGQASSSAAAPEQQEVFNQAKASAENGAEVGATTSQPSGQDSQQQSASEFIIPGTIAIEDLDKLEGMAEPHDENPDDL